MKNKIRDQNLRRRLKRDQVRKGRIKKRERTAWDKFNPQEN